MRIRMEMFQQNNSLVERLQRDGWALQPEGNRYLLAHHPLVQDERGARWRLQALGLLTAGAVRISFESLQPIPPRAHLN